MGTACFIQRAYIEVAKDLPSSGSQQISHGLAPSKLSEFESIFHTERTRPTGFRIRPFSCQCLLTSKAGLGLTLLLESNAECGTTPSDSSVLCVGVLSSLVVVTFLEDLDSRLISCSPIATRGSMAQFM